MKHLDEGSLHAWLDRDRSGMDPERSTEIERHLRECEVCAAHLREAEALTGRAASILGSVDPEDAETPPFMEVLERAGLKVPDRSSPRPGRRWLPLAWAASVAGAVGLGWWTNDLMRVEQVAFRTRPVEVANESAVDPSQAEPEIASTPTDVAGREEPASAPDATPPPTSPEQVAFAEPASPAASEVEGDLADAPAELRSSTELSVNERQVTVQGRVTDDRGQPLASAQVFAPDTQVGALTGPGAWVSVSPEEAEASVGFAPLSVPGWEVVSIELAEGDGSPAVRVLQTDEGGTVLTVIQRQGAVDMLDQLESSESTTVTITRDGLALTGTAPVPADSLRMLLERAR